MHQLRLLAAHGAERGRALRRLPRRADRAAHRPRAVRDLRIAYSYDAPELDGTLGAIRRALPLLGERFLVLYGDTYLRIDYAAVAAAWQASGLPAVMSVLRNEGRWDASNVALRRRSRARLRQARAPRRRCAGSTTGSAASSRRRSTGCRAGRARPGRALHASWQSEGLLCGFEASERFYEIGTPAALAETDAFLRAHAQDASGEGTLALEAGARPRRLAHALRTRSDLLGQGTRYALAGCVVALVYLLTTTALATLARLPFELALAIGFCAGLSVHFTLQRQFVWAGRGDFALPLRDQTIRYLAAAGTQYGLTAGGTALLPSALGLPVEAVYVAIVAVLISTNFLVFRNIVFHAEPGTADPQA